MSRQWGLIVSAAFLSAVGVLFLAPRAGRSVHDYWKERFFQRPSTNSVASLSRVQGQVTRYRFLGAAESLPERDNENVRTAAPAVYHFDRLVVDRDSSVILDLPGQYRIELLGKTEVVLELWDERDTTSPLYLHFASGDYRVIEPGTLGAVYITKGHHRFTPERRPPDQAFERWPSERPSAPPLPQVAPSRPSPDQLARAELKESLLSEAEIMRAITERTSQFRRCQANSLRENKLATGKVIIGLTIYPNGRIGSVQTVESEITNDDMNKCLRQVFERVRFRAFAGNEINMSFPLIFE